MKFDKIPKETLPGNEFDDEESIQKEKVQHNFKVMRVQGSVKWKDHGTGDPSAMLTLKRRKSKPRQTWALDLAEYTRGASADAVRTLHFDLSPDAKNEFWHSGTAGILGA